MLTWIGFWWWSEKYPLCLMIFLPYNYISNLVSLFSIAMMETEKNLLHAKIENYREFWHKLTNYFSELSDSHLYETRPEEKIRLKAVIDGIEKRRAEIEDKIVMSEKHLKELDKTIIFSEQTEHIEPNLEERAEPVVDSADVLTQSLPFPSPELGNALFILVPFDELVSWREQNPWSNAISWANAIGKDQYGIYADFVYENIMQRMRWIEQGSFLMGSPDSEKDRHDDEGPQHEVELTKGFWLADTPCTQALWQAVMGEDKNISNFRGDNRPVERVSWDNVSVFLKNLNDNEPLLALCLPTEAQWEYACRAGTTGRWYFGEDESLLGDYAWYEANSDAKTQPVAKKEPNAWGLYDMHGNVLEWCADEQRSYTQEKVQADPFGYDSNHDDWRVVRGGCWRYSFSKTRAAFRDCNDQELTISEIGFRLARV